MIWQAPEVWEILGTIEITGMMMVVSSGLIGVLGILHIGGTKNIEHEPIDKDLSNALVYIEGCIKRSGMIFLSSTTLYALLIFLLAMYPRPSVTWV